MQALIEKIFETPSITVLKGLVRHIFIDDQGVTGLQVQSGGDSFNLVTDRILIATGGIGGLYMHSTNPTGAIGGGLNLALSAGAVLRDLEFIQFHPTALNTTVSPLPLISEAIRGEGARFVDERGDFFMDGQDLAPRDIVARGVFDHLAKGHLVFLDTGPIAARLANRFPSIYASCIQAGFDPSVQPIPVIPAAHYHMGGVAVDEFGRTNIDGLYAAGEVACTGLHGANRLASNSLLEAAVCGDETGRFMASQASRKSASLPNVPLPHTANATKIRQIMSRHCGVRRTAVGLGEAANILAPMAKENPAALLSLKIVEAALARTVSVGAHARADQPMQQVA